MQYKTILSVAVLTISSAALAQVTKPGTTPPRTAMNSTMPMNSTAPSDSMNTQDETMMNDSSTPNSMAAPK